MKALSTDTLLARLLHRLALAVIRHPRWFFWPQVFLALVCLVITVVFLKFDPDQSNLVSPTLKYQQNFLHLQKEFPQQGNDLDVIVQSDDPAVRAPIYRGANRLMWTDFPYIPVYEGRRLIVASDDLREYRPNMTATPWWNAWQWDI